MNTEILTRPTFPREGRQFYGLRSQFLILSACALVLLVIIGAEPSFYSGAEAQAELWKCTPKGNAISYYTETPSFGDDVDCIELRRTRFSKPGGGTELKPGKSKNKGKKKKDKPKQNNKKKKG